MFIFSWMELNQKSDFMSKALLLALDSMMHAFLAMSGSTHALLCWKLRGGWRFPVIQHFLQINVKIIAMGKLEINSYLFKQNCIWTKKWSNIFCKYDWKKKMFIHNIKICFHPTQLIRCFMSTDCLRKQHVFNSAVWYHKPHWSWTPWGPPPESQSHLRPQTWRTPGPVPAWPWGCNPAKPPATESNNFNDEFPYILFLQWVPVFVFWFQNRYKYYWQFFFNTILSLMTTKQFVTSFYP